MQNTTFNIIRRWVSVKKAFDWSFLGKGDVSALMEVDDESSARQRDLTSGGADEDEGWDREEGAAAPIDDNSKETTPPKE